MLVIVFKLNTWISFATFLKMLLSVILFSIEGVSIRSTSTFLQHFARNVKGSLSMQNTTIGRF